MTIATVDLILERIKAAKKTSPIAVFLTDNGSLNAMFSSTIYTQKEINNPNSLLIGVFDQSMSQGEIRHKLNAARLGLAA